MIGRKRRRRGVSYNSENGIALFRLGNYQIACGNCCDFLSDGERRYRACPFWDPFPYASPFWDPYLSLCFPILGSLSLRFPFLGSLSFPSLACLSLLSGFLGGGPKRDEMLLARGRDIYSNDFLLNDFIRDYPLTNPPFLVLFKGSSSRLIAFARPF